MKKNMEDFVTCGQMKILEQRADAGGLSYYQMMENAGSGAAQVIMDRYAYWKAPMEDHAAWQQNLQAVAENKPATVGRANKSPNDNRRVMVFCGKGNNGGDGFVVARLMYHAGYDVTVVLVDGAPKTTDSIINFDLIKDLPIGLIDMNEGECILMDLKAEPDIIVDAIYGTGFRGALKDNGLKAACFINSYTGKMDEDCWSGEMADVDREPSLVVALDIPSGLRGDMTNAKELDENSVTADYTITFHARKPVHLQPFAKKYCGEVIVVDIGIDADKLWNA